MKVVIGVINHHSLLVAKLEQVADIIRPALEYVLSGRPKPYSDCGKGRGGISRPCSCFKIFFAAHGPNIVKRELSLP